MKNNYLTHMGITSWKLRKSEDDKAFFFAELKNTAEKKVGLLLADCDLSQAISSEEQKDLLQKIMESIAPCFSFEADIDKSKLYDCVILLGKNAQKYWASNHVSCSRIVESNSLCELITNPHAKKVLWENIKSLRDIFNDSY